MCARAIRIHTAVQRTAAKVELAAAKVSAPPSHMDYCPSAATLIHYGTHIVNLQNTQRSWQGGHVLKVTLGTIRFYVAHQELAITSALVLQ